MPARTLLAPGSQAGSVSAHTGSAPRPRASLNGSASVCVTATCRATRGSATRRRRRSATRTTGSGRRATGAAERASISLTARTPSLLASRPAPTCRSIGRRRRRRALHRPTKTTASATSPSPPLQSFQQARETEIQARVRCPLNDLASRSHDLDSRSLTTLMTQKGPPERPLCLAVVQKGSTS